MKRSRAACLLTTVSILVACGAKEAGNIEPADDPPDAASTFGAITEAGADRAPAPPGECSKDADCAPPNTVPIGCAEGTCDPILRSCSFRARDADFDGHRAASCIAVPATRGILVGDDCDDGDGSTYPGAPEVCDGKDHTCGAPSGNCKCVNGAQRPCYSGPAGTSGVASCKDGVQTCSNGAWGGCVGEVVPTLAMNAPPSNAHPCNGTNYWCDPNGVTPGHCPQCLTTMAPQACGSSTTCNAGATRPCTNVGTWGTCSPAPINTCVPGNSYGCSTCSTMPIAQSGSRVCTASCDFTGARCTPTGSNTPVQLYPGNSIFSHGCGAATNPANPAYWQAQPGEGPCHMVYGPYRVLPAGRYRITWSFYGASDSSTVTLDVFRNGTNCNGDTDGLCGKTVTPQNGGNTTDYTYDFRISSDCLNNWEIRTYKTTNGGRTYLYTHYLYYLGP